MQPRTAIVLTLSTALLLPGAAAQDQRPGTSVRPTFTVSKETTHITEPLTADGWPDYIGALNRRLGEGVTPENNAVVLFYRAFGPAPDGIEQSDRFFELLGVAKPPASDEYFLRLETYLRESAGLAPGEREYDEAIEQQAQAISRPWTAAQSPRVAEWLRSNEKPLALVLEGTRRPQYFSPLEGSSDDPARGLLAPLLPGVHQTRFAARALCARAMLRVAEGHREAAWIDILGCRRLGRLTGRGPTNIEGLTGIAIDAVAIATTVAFVEHTRPDAKTVERYVADLESLPRLSGVSDKIDVYERFTYLDAVLTIARNDKQLMELIGAEGFLEKLLARLSLAAIDWDVVLRIGNQWYDRLVAALRKPDRRQRNAAIAAVWDDLEEFEKQIRNAEGVEKLLADAKNPRDAVSQLVGRAMLGLLLPAFGQLAIAEDTAEQRVRNLQTALALAAYHSDHGRYPPKLDDLAPRYLHAVPDDLFSSKPLIYQPKGAGYVLYSVGANGTDDGGRQRSDDPPGDDVVVRVPSRAGE